MEYFAESKQHASSTSSTYPGSCKICFFRIPVFGRKVFLIFPIIYLTVDLKLICIIGLSDLINSLIFADSCAGWHNYSLWGLLFQFHGQLALKFHWVKMCASSTSSTLQIIEITQSVMPKPVYLLTVQEAHKEYNSLMDQIRAKYKQLDSGKYGAVGTPACVLANLLTHVSQLCQKLNMPPPKELYRPTFFKHWRHFLDQNYNRQAVCLGYGGCSFVCRYLRLTRLLSTPLVNLRIGDWLCILPAIILVVDKSKKVNKAASSDWLVVNC